MMPAFMVLCEWCFLNRRRENDSTGTGTAADSYDISIGGPAAYYLLPEREEEIIEALDFAKKEKKDFLTM